MTPNGRSTIIRMAAGLAAAAFAALFAGAASAAVPIQVGNGANVSMVVDAEGAAHVAWRQDSPPAVQYCRVPRATTEQGCPAPRTFPPANAGNGVFGRALVAMTPGRLYAPDPDTVVVLWRECCAPEQVNARVSPDSGASFSANTTLAEVGDDNPTSTSGDAILNDAATHVGWSDGNSFQWAPLGGPPVTTRADLFGPVSFGGVSTFANGQPLVVEESDLEQLSFRRNLGGDPDDEANWSAAKPIPTAGFNPKRPALAAQSEEVGSDLPGPYLAYTDSAAGYTDRLHVLEYKPGSDSFEPPSITGGQTLVADQTAEEIDVAADPAPPSLAGLDVVWSNQAGIWWSRQGRDVGFTAPTLLTELSGVTDIDLSTFSSSTCHLGPPGCGFVAARTVDGAVWVVPLYDDREPEIDVDGRSARRLGGTVPVEITCDEDCDASAAGRLGIRGGATRRANAAGALRLRPATAELGPGETARLKPKLKKKGRKLAEGALQRGRRVVAKLDVVATDLAGNETRGKLKVRLKR